MLSKLDELIKGKKFIKSREQRIDDLWKEWGSCVTEMRECISEKMTNKYNKFWIDELEKQHDDLRRPFKECRERAGVKNTTLPSNALIKGLSENTLFEIIYDEWDDFRTILEGFTIQKWGLAKKLIIYFRKLGAHIKTDELKNTEINLIEEYINEILESLKPCRDKGISKKGMGQ